MQSFETHIAFQFSTNDPQKMERAQEAMRAEVQRRNGELSLPELRSLARQVAEQHGVALEFEAAPAEMPEPWRTYLSNGHYKSYATGSAGGRGFVATNAWLLFAPDEIVEAAKAAGFRVMNMNGLVRLWGDPQGDAHPICITDENPIIRKVDGVFAQLIDVGGSKFQRSSLEPLVGMGATSGWLTASNLLFVPGIGYASPVAVVNDMDSMAERVAQCARTLVGAVGLAADHARARDLLNVLAARLEFAAMLALGQPVPEGEKDQARRSIELMADVPELRIAAPLVTATFCRRLAAELRRMARPEDAALLN